MPRKYNKKGDTLIETITAFAVIAIVGLIMVSGVIVGSRIKNQTTRYKNASLTADENLQNAQNALQNAKGSIYEVKSDGSLVALPKDADLSLRTYQGADSKNLVEYQYFDKSTLVDKNKITYSNNGGSFGMSGQWYMRFYLDTETMKKFSYDIKSSYTFGLDSYTPWPRDKKNRKFYLELTINGGYPGENGTLELEKIQGGFGGKSRRHNTNSGNKWGINYIYPNPADENWSWSTGLGWSGGVNCKGLKYVKITNPDGTTDGIKKVEDLPHENGLDNKSVPKITFPDEGGTISFYYECIVNDEYEVCPQFFDLTYYWSSYTSYGVDFNILINDNIYDNRGIDQENNNYKYIMGDGVSPIQRIVAWGRSGTQTGDNYCWNDPFNAKPFWNGGYSTPNGTVPPDKEYIKDYDDKEPTHYLYWWDKGSGSDITEVWNDYFSKKTEQSLLDIGEYKDTFAMLSFHGDIEKEFREFLRTYDKNSVIPEKKEKPYSVYQQWKNDSNWDTDDNITMKASQKNHGIAVSFYVYYLLDVYNNFGGYEYPSIVGNATKYKDWVTQGFIKNETGDARELYRMAARLYFYIYDETMYNKVVNEDWNYEKMRNYWLAVNSSMEELIKQLVDKATSQGNVDISDDFLQILKLRDPENYDTFQDFMNNNHYVQGEKNDPNKFAQYVYYGKAAVLIYYNLKYGGNYTYDKIGTYYDSGHDRKDHWDLVEDKVKFK